MVEHTPYDKTLDEGVYEITLPETFIVNDTTYRFVSWGNGDPQPIKTITLTSGTSLNILYLQEQVYDTTPPTIHQWISLGKPMKRMSSPRNGSRHIKADKPYLLNIISKNYVKHVLNI